MFLRWLTTVFPDEMRGGWGLIKANLVFWCALAAGMALLAASPTTAPGAAETFLLAMTTLSRILLVPLVLSVAAIRFRTIRASCELDWAEVASAAAKRLIPVLFTWLLAAGLCRGLSVVAQAVVVATLQATGQTMALVRVWAELVGAVVFVGLLLRFVFAPFIAALDRRSAHSPATKSRFAALAHRVGWPLMASNRMTGNIRQRIVAYVVLWFYAPGLAAWVPSAPRPVASFALHLLSFTALAVLFNYYDERARNV